MIFYFSGTGNTRWAAEQLAEATGERLIAIAEAPSGVCTYELQPEERVGFCFPVHGWQPPHIVRQFIRRLKLQRAKGARPYCYALVTCGDSIGRTMEMLDEELRAVGLLADSVFSLVMPESYVCLPFMYTDPPAREQGKIATARQQLKQYADLIVRRVGGERHTHRGLTPWLFSHVIGAYFNRFMITDKKFMVDADVCIHCGKCAKVCPTGNLTMSEDGDNALPQWHHDGSCTNCLACYHYCPRHAINYGDITRKRGQYYFKDYEY